jgi:hypothetical protein
MYIAKISIDKKFILEFIVTLASSNGESHVDTAKDVVGVGLAIEESLTFIVTLELKDMYKLTFNKNKQ